MVRRITLHCLLTTPESIRAEIERLGEDKLKMTDTGLIRIVDWIIESLRERLDKLETREKRPPK